MAAVELVHMQARPNPQAALLIHCMYSYNVYSMLSCYVVHEPLPTLQTLSPVCIQLSFTSKPFTLSFNPSPPPLYHANAHLLHIQPQEGLVEVADSTVDQLGALAASATAEVIPLNKGRLQTWPQWTHTQRDRDRSSRHLLTLQLSWLWQ